MMTRLFSTCCSLYNPNQAKLPTEDMDRCLCLCAVLFFPGKKLAAVKTYLLLED